jgi:hypothetical protein
MFTRAWEADIVMESFQFTPDAGGGSNQQAREIMSRTMIIIPVDFHPSFSRLLRWITDTGVPGEAASAWRGCGKLKMAHQSVPSSWKATDYSRPGLDKFHYVAHHGRRERDCRAFSIASANRRYPCSVRKSASLFLPHGRNLFPFRTIQVSFQLRKSMRANLFNSQARSSRSCFRSGKKNGTTVSHMPMLQNLMSGQHPLEG